MNYITQPSKCTSLARYCDSRYDCHDTRHKYVVNNVIHCKWDQNYFIYYYNIIIHIIFTGVNSKNIKYAHVQKTQHICSRHQFHYIVQNINMYNAHAELQNKQSVLILFIIYSWSLQQLNVRACVCVFFPNTHLIKVFCLSIGFV